MKWFRRHDSKLEYAVCRVCGSKFIFKKAEKLEQCPGCKTRGRVLSDAEKESKSRVGGR